MSSHCSYAQWLTNQTTNDAYNINTSGKVGIGTPTPSYKLDVLGPISGGVNDYSFNSATYQLTNQSRVDGISGVSPTGAFRWYTNPNNNYKEGFLYQLRSFDVVGGESPGLLTIRGDGFVGIGAANPSNKLTVFLNSGTGNVISWGNVGGGVFGALGFDANGSYLSKFDNTPGIYLNGASGYIGIGTPTPTAKLDIVGGTVQVTNSSPTYALIDNSNSNYSWSIQNTAGAYRIYDNTANAERMRVTSSGNVLIGKNAQQPGVDYKLDVGGSARADKIVVNTTGADFVFDKKYPLPKLSDVKAYIDEHQHLPEIPSAKEMQTNGMSVGEINTKLLQKVEELTLYLIDKDKQLSEQNVKLAEQQNKNTEQEARIAALEKALTQLMRNNPKSGE